MWREEGRRQTDRPTGRQGRRDAGRQAGREVGEVGMQIQTSQPGRRSCHVTSPYYDVICHDVIFNVISYDGTRVRRAVLHETRILHIV